MIILGGNIYLDFRGKGEFYMSEIIKFVLIKKLCIPVDHALPADADSTGL